MKTKRIISAILALASIFTLIMVIPATVSAEDTQANRNFEYIVSMIHGEVNIVYEWEIIITGNLAKYDQSRYPNVKRSCAIFDFNGKNLVKYGVYDDIEVLFGVDSVGNVYGVEYLLAKSGEKEYLLDRNLKRIELPNNEKVAQIPGIFYTMNLLVTENNEYYKLKNIATGKETVIYKKDIFSLPGDKPDGEWYTAEVLYDDFIVFNTTLSTVVFSTGGELLYRFEKTKFGIIQYSRSLDFNSDGYAVYRDKNGLCGVVDIYGNIIVTPQYQDIGIGGNRLYIWEDGKSGLVHFDGNVIIAMQDDSIDRITDDIYIFSNYKVKKPENITSRIVSLSDPDKYKHFNYDYVWCINYETGHLITRKNGKYGFALLDGTVLVPPKYDSLDDNSYWDDSVDGRFIVGTGPDYSRKYGLIDSNGNEILPVIYDRIGNFSEGLCSVEYWGEYDDANYKYHGRYVAYVDKNGKETLQLENDMYSPSNFSEGLGIARRGDSDFGKCVYFDKTGKIIISGGDWSNCAYPFKNGLAVTTNYVSGGSSNYNTMYGVIKYIPPKVGDVMGDVLYSDITAYINGNAIPTSIINGKTLVVAEDLAKYGFDVKWDGADRTLKAEINKNKKIAPLKVEKDTTHKPGAFKCNYLYTDIKTYLSGEEVESFAIDGRTLVDFELLAKYGKLTWNGEAREIRLVIE